MSVIDEALRKLEDERIQQARQDNGEYLAAPVLVVRSTSLTSGLLWLVLGGVVVGVAVWIWEGTASQRPLPVAAVASLTAVVAEVPAVEPIQPVVMLPDPVVDLTLPVVTLPVSAEAVSVAGPVATTPVPPTLAWQSPVWVRSAATLMTHGDRVGALQGWSQGLARLSPKDALIVLPATATNTEALTLYRSVSGQFPALLAQENDSLRVLLIPDADELGDVLTDLRTYLKRRTLRTTSVAVWRAEIDVRNDAKLSVPVAVQPAVALKPAVVASPERMNSALVELESVSSARGTANSSAAEILSRFNEVERMLSQGQFDLAAKTVEQVEAEVGVTWQTNYLKGTAAQGLRRWEDAIQALTKAHQLNPASMEVLLNRAICRQEIGQHEAALDDLRLATVLSPGTPELVANSAYSLDALERPAEALVQYQKFLEMTAGRGEYAKLRAWASKRVVR
ncbi:MAG: tetratricopeptide repeat protein [Polaromonas sp.]|nr:tetratricopeptide repeat protein [Polaromonas sp.]